jgi:hypothetical protein
MVSRRRLRLDRRFIARGSSGAHQRQLQRAGRTAGVTGEKFQLVVAAI